MNALDKEEFRIKLEEINRLVEKKNYKDAMEVVDSIDWRRVKNVRTLCVVGEIYAANKRYEDSKEIFLLAYHRAPIGKNILYRLIEVSLKMKDIQEEKRVVLDSIASRMGNKTIELENVSKSYDNRKLISDYSYIFLKNDRIGIIGPNGCGKTTLLKIINGIVRPDSGTIEIGQTIRIGYFSQENEYMDASMKVIDYVKEVGEYVTTSDGKITASQMLERFLFDGAMQWSKIEKLSGGEKRRLYLMRVLMSAPNPG